MSADKVELRIRRTARRRGYGLQKSRRRDVNALDYNSFWLFDDRTGLLLAGNEFGVSLDEIEQFLTKEKVPA